jgi:hypothetical protein
MPTRRTARARAGTRRRSQRNMMAIGRGKHGAGRNSRPAKLQSNFSPRTPEQQRKPRSTRDQRAKRFNNLENPTKSAKPPPPVQIRAPPPIFPKESEAHRSARSRSTGHCAQIVPVSIVRSVRLQPDRGLEGVQLLRGFDEITTRSRCCSARTPSAFCGRQLHRHAFGNTGAGSEHPCVGGRAECDPEFRLSRMRSSRLS